MAIQAPRASRPPSPQTWDNIQRRISRTEAADTPSFWQRLLASRGQRWGFATALLLAVLVLPLGWWIYDDAPQAPNSDYVAVLADEGGKPRLTAMTLAGGETLWLQWQDLEVEANASIQLWAVSRRDGQARSIAVFEALDTGTLPLDQARRRLIADADYLLLTEEGPGGSPLDEPSADSIARGACVRLGSS